LNLNRRQDIERFLNRPDPAVRVALFYGRDLGVVRERGAELAAKVADRPDDPFDVALVTEADLDEDPGRLVDELMALSMMGGRRLVRLRLASERAAPGRLAADALERHAAGEYNPEAFFLIEAGDLGRDSALRKAAEKATAAAAIPCYEDEPGDLARLTREALAKDRLALTAEALDLFVRRLPHERGVARREIERLALYLGPGTGVTGTADDLTDFLGVEPEASLSEAAQDAFGGRLAAAQAALRRAANEGERGPAAVRAMGQHLMRLRRTATLRAAGAELAQAAKQAGVFWKNEREFLRQARAWDLPQLDEVQPEILAADRACKQTGAPDQLIAERLALAIAAKARRLGL
jgi:DNA polymerase III subunit delta